MQLPLLHVSYSPQAWLQQLGCDTSGLLLSDLPTPRAWQLFEWDGKRTQVSYFIPRQQLVYNSWITGVAIWIK